MILDETPKPKSYFNSSTSHLASAYLNLSKKRRLAYDDVIVLPFGGLAKTSQPYTKHFSYYTYWHWTAEYVPTKWLE